MSRYCPQKNLVFVRFLSFLFTLTNKTNSGQCLAPTFFCQPPGNPATRQKLDKLWTWGNENLSGVTVRTKSGQSLDQDRLWTKTGLIEELGQIIYKMWTRQTLNKLWT